MTTAYASSRTHDEHYQEAHVERPERLHAIQERMQQDAELTDLLLRPEAASADVSTATLLHTESYVETLQQAAEAGESLDGDTYTTSRSMDVAIETLGIQQSLADLVMTGEADNSFAATRPPGHHATPVQAMGFCLLNFVGIVAKWIRATHGVERIAIVDFDVHHGNGTQDAFYADPQTLFVSIHQHPLYPGTGMAHETGHGDAEGTTINLPLPARCGDQTYLQAMDEVVRPAVSRFGPDVLLVSAGFDAHAGDPLGSMDVSTGGFAAIMKRLMEISDASCEGRLIAALEGGYNTNVLADSVHACIRELAGLPAAPSLSVNGETGSGHPTGQRLISDVADRHGLVA